MSFAASVSPEAAALIADIDLKEANDPRVVVTRKEAMLMLGVKQTKLLELEAAGILRSFLDGASRRISAASIYGRLRALAVASHPLNAEPAKVRRPKHMRRRRASAGPAMHARPHHDACSPAAANEKGPLSRRKTAARPKQTATTKPDQARQASKDHKDKGSE
jgi:hypothetical protein